MNKVTKNSQGYGYKYTDLAQIHNWLEENDMSYYQYIETIDGSDYIMTVPCINGKNENPRRGVKIVDAVLQGIKNPAQEQGSATTYARRYSLLMAFGLATEDDDGASLTKKEYPKKVTNKENIIDILDKGTELQKITKTQEEALILSIKNNNISDEQVEEILSKYGYSSTNEIQIKNFKNIVDDMKKLIGD